MDGSLRIALDSPRRPGIPGMPLDQQKSYACVL